MTFKKLFEANGVKPGEVIIFKGPEKTVEKIDDALSKWNDENDYAFQDYYSHKVGIDRQIVVEDPKGYKKVQKEFEKIIKKYK